MQTGQTIANGRYRLERFVARGGMGAIYQGIDLQLNRRVALKVLHTSNLPAQRDLALKEARALAALHHPNIISVFDVVSDMDAVFLVTEWVEGRSLAQVKSPLHPLTVCCILAQILDGLSAIHESSLIHRDIKPSNIMIAHDGRVLLIDFGVALAQGGSAGHTMAGTLRYSDPRILEGSAATRETDVFSLGLVMLEMLTGDQMVPDLAPIPLYKFFKHSFVQKVEAATEDLFPPLKEFLNRALLPQKTNPKNSDYSSTKIAEVLQRVGLPNPRQFIRENIEQASNETQLDALLHTFTLNQISTRNLAVREMTDYLAYKETFASPPPKTPTPPKRKYSRAVAWGAAILCVSSVVTLFYVKYGTKSMVTPAVNVETSTQPTAPSEPEFKADPLELTDHPTLTNAAPESQHVEPEAIKVALATPKKQRVTEKPKTAKTALTPPKPVEQNIEVRLSANVWADVYIDGELVGRIPRAKPFLVSPGIRQFTLQNPFTETQQKFVTLTPSQRDLHLRFSLEQKRVDKQ